MTKQIIIKRNAVKNSHPCLNWFVKFSFRQAINGFRVFLNQDNSAQQDKRLSNVMDFKEEMRTSKVQTGEVTSDVKRFFNIIVKPYAQQVPSVFEKKEKQYDSANCCCTRKYQFPSLRRSKKSTNRLEYFGENLTGVSHTGNCNLILNIGAVS